MPRPTLAAIVVLALLGPAGAGRAEPIPFHLSWDVTPGTVTADGSTGGQILLGG